MTRPQTRTTLSLPFAPAFLALATEFVEKSAHGFGYGARETAGLVLATEELFSFYLRQVASDTDATLELEDQGYRLALTFSFRLSDPDLRAFNLTWNVDPDSDESLDTLGPMLAARSVSSLRIEFAADERVVLRLTRDRAYPAAPTVALPPVGLKETLHLADPSPDDLRHFAALAASAAPPFLPTFLAHPAMAGDMHAAGHLHAVLALRGDWIVGGVLWRPLTDSCLELYGPYCLTDDDDDRALTLLLDEAVSRISRTGYRGLLRRQGPLPGHQRFFDFLGEIELAARAGAPLRSDYYFRQLKEESGGIVYCDGALATFLAGEYERLCLPRQLRETSGESAAARRAASVLAVEFSHFNTVDAAHALATLRPLCAGRDMAANLAAHVKLLRGDNIANIQVEIDTGRSDDTAFAQALEQTGFVPRLLIPDAGRGDLVIYDQRGDAAGS